MRGNRDFACRECKINNPPFAINEVLIKDDNAPECYHLCMQLPRLENSATGSNTNQPYQFLLMLFYLHSVFV